MNPDARTSMVDCTPSASTLTEPEATPATTLRMTRKTFETSDSRAAACCRRPGAPSVKSLLSPTAASAIGTVYPWGPASSVQASCAPSPEVRYHSGTVGGYPAGTRRRPPAIQKRIKGGRVPPFIRAHHQVEAPGVEPGSKGIRPRPLRAYPMI